MNCRHDGIGKPKYPRIIPLWPIKNLCPPVTTEVQSIGEAREFGKRTFHLERLSAWNGRTLRNVSEIHAQMCQ